MESDINNARKLLSEAKKIPQPATKDAVSST